MLNLHKFSFTVIFLLSIFLKEYGNQEQMKLV